VLLQNPALKLYVVIILWSIKDENIFDEVPQHLKLKVPFSRKCEQLPKQLFPVLKILNSKHKPFYPYKSM